jgi:hypothetical protein
MLENWIFMTGFLGFSLIFLFHGCILLIAPDRYIPSYTWGQPNLVLVRKRPFELGKRFLGLFFSGLAVWVFARPAIIWMLHPTKREISWGPSPLPQGMARWDMLGLALFALVCGYFLFTRPEKSVELMFTADRTKLNDKTTLRLWTLETQVFAFLFMVWSLLPMADFVRSLRH